VRLIETDGTGKIAMHAMLFELGFEEIASILVGLGCLAVFIAAAILLYINSRSGGGGGGDGFGMD
jgi:hypothetical protein